MLHCRDNILQDFDSVIVRIVVKTKTGKIHICILDRLQSPEIVGLESDPILQCCWRRCFALETISGRSYTMIWSLGAAFAIAMLA